MQCVPPSPSRFTDSLSLSLSYRYTPPSTKSVYTPTRKKNAAGGRYRPQHQLQQVSTIDLHRRVRVGLGWALGKLGNWARFGAQFPMGMIHWHATIYAHICPFLPIRPYPFFPFPSPPILPHCTGSHSGPSDAPTARERTGAGSRSRGREGV